MTVGLGPQGAQTQDSPSQTDRLQQIMANAWTGPWKPRKWQAEALPLVIGGLLTGANGLIVVAVMGSGKSILQGETLRLALPKLTLQRPAVVSVPTRKLVDQLAATLAEGLGAENVGSYYTEAKQSDRRVIVVCNASLPEIGAEFVAQGRRAAMWLADEAHKTESATVKAASEQLRAAARIGFTATPFRSEKGETLSLWKSVVFRYTLGDALADGVLVPWRIENWKKGGQLEEGERPDVDNVSIRMVQDLAEGPGLINANTITDAEAFAARCCAKGIPAKAIHSKQSKTVQAGLIEALRTGEIKALVHVNMLSEGVDFPWLRWLCLRRQSAARVRFIQEIGRVLRSAPDKTEALFLDPGDLFIRMGLSHEAALGEAIEREGGESLPAAEEGEWEGNGAPSESPLAVHVSDLEAFIRDAVLVLHAAGYGQRFRWREDGPATDDQLARVRRMRWAARMVEPSAAREFLEETLDAAPDLARSVVSDLLTLLYGIGQMRRAEPQAVLSLARLKLPSAP